MPVSNELREAAKTAIAAQDACNLSGVLVSFYKIVLEVLWPEARNRQQGTAWVNQHPIVTLFTDKLMALNCHQCLCNGELESYNKAYAKVKALSEGKEEEAPTETSAVAV